jgi:tripartite-type tricarboxylate transporter receptor subunit TctC
MVLIITMCIAGQIWAAGGNQQGGRVWPTTRNVEMVVPFGAGGGNDLMGRLLAVHMSKAVGANIYVTNDTSGGGTVAYERIRNGPPDGYLFMFTSLTPFFQYYSGMYDHNLLDDFTFIAKFHYWNDNEFFVVKADSPFKTFQEFMEFAKANPNRLGIPCGSMQLPYAQTVAAEKSWGVQFRKMDGATFAERISSILRGDTDFFFTVEADVGEYIKSGQVRYLAYNGNERSIIRSDIPCVKELGYPIPKEYSDNLGGQLYLIGPKGMSESVAEAIAESLKGVAEDKELCDSVFKLRNSHPSYMTRAEALKFFQRMNEISRKLLTE